MKILIYVLSVLVATVLLTAGIFLVVLQSPRHVGFLVLLPTFALSLFVYGPLMLGGISAYWTVKKSAESIRYFRRWVGVVTGLEVLGGVGIVAYTVLVGAPVWIPIILIGGCVALTGVAFLVARLWTRLDRTERSRPDLWTPITRDEIVRRIRTITITFVITLVVAVGGFAALYSVLPFSPKEAPSPILAAFPYGVEFAAFAAGMACILVTIPLNRRIRSAVSDDIGYLRRLSKGVLGRKAVDFDEEDLPAAAKYAVLIGTTLSFQLAYLTLLYLGLVIQNVVSLTSGDAPVFTGWLVGLLVLLYLVVAPYMLVRIRRARAFARTHADSLPSEAEISNEVPR